MCGNGLQQQAMFSPLFKNICSLTGRPSIPPEQILGALLLHVFHAILSKQMLLEQLEYNLLFR